MLPSSLPVPAYREYASRLHSLAPSIWTFLTRPRLYVAPRLYHQFPRTPFRTPARYRPPLVAKRSAKSPKLPAPAANPVYTILCGFDPDKLPAPQTFRDFLDRLASLRKSLKAKRVRKVKTSRAERKKKKSQQGEKSPERPGLVEKLLARQLNPQEEEELARTISNLEKEEAEKVIQWTTSYHEKGRAEGRKEGRIEAKREDIAQFLSARFDLNPTEFEPRLSALRTPEELALLL